MKKSFFSAFSKQTRQLVLHTAVVLGLAVAQIFLWQYVHSSARALQNKRTEVQQFENLRKRIAAIEAGGTQADPLFGQLSAIFPREDSASQLVERLEKTADTQGVLLRIKTIKEGENLLAKGKENLQALELTVEAEGPPNRLLAYIDAVEHAPEAAQVKTWLVRSQPSVGEDGTPIVRHMLTATVVFFLYTPSK